MTQSVIPAAQTYELYIAIKEQDSDKIRFKMDFSEDDARAALTSEPKEAADTEHGDRENDPPKLPPTLEDEIESLLRSITTSMAGFRSLIDLSGTMAKAVLGELTSHKIRDFSNRNLSFISEVDGVKVFGVPGHNTHELISLMEERNNLLHGFSFFPPSILMSVVSYYDSALSDMLRLFLKANPSRYAKSEKNFTASELMKMSSIEDILNKIVEDDIDSLMRGSHANQIIFIDRTFKTKIKDDFKRWANFVEIFERRNIIAHGIGAVNDIYVKNCAEAGLKSVPEVGDVLPLNRGYLAVSANTLHEMLLVVLFELWNKISSGEKTRLYSAFNEISFNLLKSKRYVLSAKISQYVLDKNDLQSCEECRRMLAVNLAIAHKMMDHLKGVDDALGRFQWSSVSSNFRICISAIKEDIRAVVELMPSVTASNELGKSAFRTWPAFHWVRENAEVREQFRQLFGEPLVDDGRSPPEGLEVGETSLRDTANALEHQIQSQIDMPQ